MRHSCLQNIVSILTVQQPKNGNVPALYSKLRGPVQLRMIAMQPTMIWSKKRSAKKHRNTNLWCATIMEIRVRGDRQQGA
jgi:hypothetical protein